MNKNNKIIYWFLTIAAILVIVDEKIKNFGLQYFPDEQKISQVNFFNLGIHKNLGLAFDIPFRKEFILLVSLIIGYFLIKMVIKNFSIQPKISFACLLIVFGALGNIYDRIIYGFTVDYIIILGKSAFNISDLIIIFGVILLLITSRRNKTELQEKHPDLTK